MALYRGAPVVLTGPWRSSRKQAMRNALASEQTKLPGDNVLRSSARIEEVDSSNGPQDGPGRIPSGDAERFVPENAEQRLLSRGATRSVPIPSPTSMTGTKLLGWPEEVRREHRRRLANNNTLTIFPHSPAASRRKCRAR